MKKGVGLALLSTVVAADAQVGVDVRGRREIFRTYAWDVEMKYTVGAKVKQFDWGLLQGKLEAR